MGGGGVGGAALGAGADARARPHLKATLQMSSCAMALTAKAVTTDAPRDVPMYACSSTTMCRSAHSCTGRFHERQKPSMDVAFQKSPQKARSPKRSSSAATLRKQWKKA
jgi:hypothetical protein